MYLHIGDGYTVNSQRILGIFSYELKDLKNNKILFEFLEANRRFVYIGDAREYKSIVLTKDFTAYVTYISMATLIKRLNNSFF